MARIQHILILHDIRSEQNVGSLFRTADAAGIDLLVLSGITPTPIDRFGRSVGTIAKTALGAEQTVPWERVTDIDATIDSLKQNGCMIVAIEQSEKSIDYKDVPISKPVAFILGNEVEGLPTSIIEKSDSIAEIPMRGKKESLNVSVAGGIALFRMLGI